jgi:putative redox protein
MTDTIPAAVQVVWAGEGQFDAGRAGGPSMRIDSAASTGPSPVDALLSALGACAAVDVVDILAKRRTPVESLTVDVQAERVNGTPRRLAHATLNFTISGAGIERAHAERAIDLAVNKYCSVRDSLRSDVPVDWTLTLVDENSHAAVPARV